MIIYAEAKFNVGEKAVWMVDWYTDQELNRLEVEIKAVIVWTDGNSTNITYQVNTGYSIEDNVSELNLIKIIG